MKNNIDETRTLVHRINNYISWSRSHMSVICFINCTLRESILLQGTYLILVESMPDTAETTFLVVM